MGKPNLFLWTEMIGLWIDPRVCGRTLKTSVLRSFVSVVRSIVRSAGLVYGLVVNPGVPMQSVTTYNVVYLVVIKDDCNVLHRAYRESSSGVEVVLVRASWFMHSEC